MEDPPPPLPDGTADDIFDKISVPAYDGGDAAVAGMVFHLTSGDGTASVSAVAGGGSFPGTVFPPGLSARPEVPAKEVLSMSRLRVAGAVPQIGEGGGSKPVWEKWSNNGMEEQVVKLMEDVKAAMQFLLSKALCIIRISIAATIYRSRHQNEIPAAKPETDTPS